MQEALLPGTKIMLAFGVILLYGGLTTFISIALLAERRKKQQA